MTKPIVSVLRAVVGGQMPDALAWDSVRPGLEALLKEHFARHRWPLPPYDQSTIQRTIVEYLDDGLLCVCQWALQNVLGNEEDEELVRRSRNRFLEYLSEAYRTEVATFSRRGEMPEQDVSEPAQWASPDPDRKATEAYRRFQAFLRRYPTALSAWLERSEDRRLRLCYLMMKEGLAEGRDPALILTQVFSAVEGQALRFPTHGELMAAWFRAALAALDDTFSLKDLGSLFGVGGKQVYTLRDAERRWRARRRPSPVVEELSLHFRRGSATPPATELLKRFRSLLSTKS